MIMLVSFFFIASGDLSYVNCKFTDLAVNVGLCFDDGMDIINGFDYRHNSHKDCIILCAVDIAGWVNHRWRS